MMRKNTYHEYLLSKEWADFRLTVRKEKRGRCTGCRNIRKLVLHHLLYRDNLSDVKPNECIWLCRECHFLYHFLLGRHLIEQTYRLMGIKKIRSFGLRLVRWGSYKAGYYAWKNPPALRPSVRRQVQKVVGSLSPDLWEKIKRDNF